MYKSKLQELCHNRSWSLPEYATVRDGPDHNPRFSGTVIVNGFSFETPNNQCRSSKEAQNLAAQLAFDHLTAEGTISQQLPLPLSQLVDNPYPSPSVSSPSPSAHLSGSSSSSTYASIWPNEQETLHFNAIASRTNGSPFGFEDDKRPKDVLHMYKNRLQQYAQKHALGLPNYSCEFDGPPHVRRFRSKVTVGDKTFESSEFFSTLKEAEHSAAKVAFESLSHDDNQEDESLYKILLQQFAQKEGLVPKYITTKSGPSHIPAFTSIVEIGADVFQGQEAKSKKHAEIRAAKVAYNALIERRARDIPPCGYKMKGASNITSCNMQPVQSNIDSGLQQETANVHPVNIDEAARNKECHLKEVASSSSTGSLFPAVPQQNIQPKAELNPTKEPDEVQASTSLQLMDPNSLLKEPEQRKPGAGLVSCSKIIVYPRNSDISIPDGGNVLPFSDDKWVAMEYTPIC